MDPEPVCVWCVIAAAIAALAGLVLYALIGATVAGLCRRFQDTAEGAGWAGVLWPLTLPGVLVLMLVHFVAACCAWLYRWAAGEGR